MKTTVIVFVITIVSGVAPAEIRNYDLTGATIITEDAVQSGDGFPFDNTAFDPNLLAVTGGTVFFASVNVTSTYLDTRVFAFGLDSDETSTAAIEVFNDLALKSLFGGSASFWFASAGDLAGTSLFAITAEDADADDNEFIEPMDIERIIRVDVTSGQIDNVIASNGADGVTGLTEIGGALYLTTSTQYGAFENRIVTVPAGATDGFFDTMFTESEVTLVTGGTSPQLSCIATTPTGDLVFADNQTGQVLQVEDPQGTPVLSVLIDAQTLASTVLGEVGITGLGVLSTGEIVISDTLESADLADDRGLAIFDAAGQLEGVVALESQIVAVIPADDHLGFTPNNELRIDASDRLIMCSTDNSESIFRLDDPSFASLFRDGFESGDTSAWAQAVTH